MRRYANNPCDRPWWMRQSAGGNRMALEPRMILTAVHVFGPTPKGGFQGTGFIMTVESENAALKSHRWAYVLTAHHVIKDMDPVYVEVPNAFGGGEMYPARVVDCWTQPVPGLDLAVAPLPVLPGQMYSAMRWEHMLPTEGSAPIGGPMLGSTVYYIGLFAPAQRMMARQGSLGALDVVGLAHDPGAAPPYDYACHLVDCRSYGGFSGSPCFFQLTFAKLRPDPVPSPFAEEAPMVLPEMGGLIDLAVPCGMFTEHYDDTGAEDEKPQTGEGAVSRYGVGVMVRGEDIKGALMTDKLREQRRLWDAAELVSRAAAPRVAPRSAGSGRQDWTPTADLMGKLLQVPKHEADEVHRGHSAT